MSDRDHGSPARPDGFTDRTSDLASQHAHEQGWRIIEVGKNHTPKAKNGASGGKVLGRAERPLHSKAVNAEPAAAAPAVAANSGPEKAKSPLAKKNLNHPNVIWVRNRLEETAA